MKNIVVFASGFGSNFQAIIEASEQGHLTAHVVGLICDQADAYVITRANQHHIPVKVILRSDYHSKAAMDQTILEQCQTWNADYLILAGYMRLLSPFIIHAYPSRILNIHPSLLPKYKGLHAIEQAIANQEKEYGVTIHYVDEGMDTGEIIEQCKFSVEEIDYEAIKQKISYLEQVTYVQVIQKIMEEEHEKSSH
ncbi:MAG: phosphoribosylglycinamide formyltransferase [Erysipelothrix sp.]|nr:phosphoribosylglycinamide formyltransferase [Erysipelothrix sp.]